MRRKTLIGTSLFGAAALAAAFGLNLSLSPEPKAQAPYSAPLLTGLGSARLPGRSDYTRRLRAGARLTACLR